ncbi:ABC transporter ATP-binding protein [Microbacterium immunditiarum]|uniref:Putative ABC transport system ATP-binding protein n=1 Tax=Microbacterium immunditiarum TaxID=337480 RepID=A0A7Y9GPD1_9MICO|nr:ABC transporter ATP-binding protein [Microbacterium immunditiarum]NYE20223.1 putative ABC transport system ATP-binding protein [Microbacterium immunditiarum]
MTADVIARCEQVTKTYGRGAAAVHAVRDASIALRAGEVVVLQGPSGSGKTTLLNLIGSLDAPDSGRIWVGDREVTGANEQQLVELRRHDLGFVFQTFALLPVLSARENVDLPLRLAGVRRRERERRVSELLDAVGLTAHAEQRPPELSGGQQQRLGIARALATRPRLLIADEPTGQLDSLNAEAMMGLIAGMVHERGIAAIVSTHDARIAAHADRLVSIHDGVVAAT